MCPVPWQFVPLAPPLALLAPPRPPLLRAPPPPTAFPALPAPARPPAGRAPPTAPAPAAPAPAPPAPPLPRPACPALAPAPAWPARPPAPAVTGAPPALANAPPASSPPAPLSCVRGASVLLEQAADRSNELAMEMSGRRLMVRSGCFLGVQSELDQYVVLDQIVRHTRIDDRKIFAVDGKFRIDCHLLGLDFDFGREGDALGHPV